MANAQGPEGSQPVKHHAGSVPNEYCINWKLDCKIDLEDLALKARNAEYNPKPFAAVIMRLREPRTTAFIFASGGMVCIGAKSEQDSKLAARKYARIVQKLGFPVKFKDFKIRKVEDLQDSKIQNIERMLTKMRLD